MTEERKPSRKGRDRDAARAVDPAPTAPARKPVQVCCDIPNGVSLRLAEPFNDGFATQMRFVGEPVILTGPRSLLAEQRDYNSPEITDVDPEFWAAWLEQNQRNTLVTQRRVYAFEPPPESAEQKG